MVIEPILEADFQPSSFGFQPKRDAFNQQRQVAKTGKANFNPLTLDESPELGVRQHVHPTPSRRPLSLCPGKARLEVMDPPPARYHAATAHRGPAE